MASEVRENFFPIFGPRKEEPPPKKSRSDRSDAEIKSNKKLYEHTKRKREFQQHWLKEFAWLCHSDTGMTCKICQQFESAGPFITGTVSYRKDSLTTHEDSDTHKHNVLKERNRKNPTDSQGYKTYKQLTSKTHGQLSLKFRNSHMISMKGRAFTDYLYLCDLDEAKGLDIGSTYRTDKAAKNFTYYIAETERNRIRNSLSKSKFISVISDVTTDTSYQEAEIVYVRSCNHGTISVYFSEITNVQKADASTLCDVMLKGAKNLCSQAELKLVATGTDGASTMMGSKTGAVQRIREKLKKPYLIGIHCNGHKLELAFKDTLKQKIPLYNILELFLLNIYYFYRNSNSNRSSLKESYKTLSLKINMPTRVGGTRWIAHQKLAIEVFLKGYDAFIQHLGQLQNRDSSVSRTDKGNKAKGFYRTAMRRDFWLMLHFVLDVLSILVEISKKFQERAATMTDILSEIEIAASSLEKMKTRNGIHSRDAVRDPRELIGDDRAFVSARQKFLSAIIDSLKQRFTDNPGLISSFSVLNLTLFPSADEIEDYGDVEIDTLTDYFRQPLQEAGVVVESIASEWTKLKGYITKRFDSPQEATWQDVNKKLKMVCPNILSLVDLVLTIPASSADAERGFSRLKYTKTDARSRLLDKTLSDQLCIMLESCEIKNFDLSPAIDLWNGISRRTCSDLDVNERVSTPTTAIITGSSSKEKSAELVTVSHKKTDNVQVSAETTLSLDEESVEVLHVGDDKKDENNNVVEIVNISSDLCQGVVAKLGIDGQVSLINDLNSSQSEMQPVSGSSANSNLSNKSTNDLNSSQSEIQPVSGSSANSNLSNKSTNDLNSSQSEMQPVSGSSVNSNLSNKSTNDLNFSQSEMQPVSGSSTEIGVDTADLFWGVNKGVNTEESIYSEEDPCEDYESDDDYSSEHKDPHTEYEPVASYTDRLKLAANAYTEFCSSLDFFECRVSV